MTNMKTLTKETTFGKTGTAVITVNMWQTKTDALADRFGRVESTAKVEIFANGKRVVSANASEVMAIEHNIVYADRYEVNGWDVDATFSAVGRAVTTGNEKALEIQAVMKELEEELAAMFGVKTKAQQAQEQAIEEAEYVIEQATKYGVDTLMTNEELRQYNRTYNRVMNEGGEGYIPPRVSKEQYEKALCVIEGAKQ